MTCKVCYGYGFKRDGKPLSPANTCVHCIDANVCPSCDLPMSNEHEPECSHCGWCWDDPENLTKAQQEIAMRIVIAKLFGEPIPEIIDDAYILDFDLGIQVMWDDPSGEQQCAPLHPTAFAHIFPSSDNKPEIKAVDYAAYPQGRELLEKVCDYDYFMTGPDVPEV